MEHAAEENSGTVADRRIRDSSGVSPRLVPPRGKGCVPLLQLQFAVESMSLPCPLATPPRTLNSLTLRCSVLSPFLPSSRFRFLRVYV